MKVKETVSDEAREDQWSVLSIDTAQHTEERQKTRQVDEQE